MESFEIGLTLAFAVALIINIKNVDWKSAKTYKVAVLNLLNDKLVMSKSLRNLHQTPTF